jgi:lycopene cyclase domain-containing protein
MTYLQFHLVYILPVVALLLLVQARPIAGHGAGVAFRWLGAILALAFVYTTPWDNYLVYRDVWGYPAGAVLFTIGYVPIEEYAFFILQPILGGLFYFLLRGRGWLRPPAGPAPGWFRPAIAGIWGAAAVAGVAMLLHPSDHALYMGLILGWAAPVLAGIAWIGAHKIWGDLRRVAFAIAVPTVYLWFADRAAIQKGIWDIRDAYSFNIDPLGLPIEEATFFLVTMSLCVMGLALFLPDPIDANQGA